MHKLDYYQLILRGFEALKREISEAEQFTIAEHNNLLNQINVEQQQSHAKQNKVVEEAKDEKTITKK